MCFLAILTATLSVRAQTWRHLRKWIYPCVLLLLTECYAWSAYYACWELHLVRQADRNQSSQTKQNKQNPKMSTTSSNVQNENITLGQLIDRLHACITWMQLVVYCCGKNGRSVCRLVHVKMQNEIPGSWITFITVHCCNIITLDWAYATRNEIQHLHASEQTYSPLEGILDF